MSFEEFFRIRFVEFLDANFPGPGQATAIAHAFGVRERTAENWLAGVNVPKGTVVARALVDPRLGPALMTSMGVEWNG